MLAGTPVGCWMETKASDWTEAQRSRIAGLKVQMGERGAVQSEARAQIRMARTRIDELQVVLRRVAQRAWGTELRWKKWLCSTGQWTADHTAGPTW